MAEAENTKINFVKGINHEDLKSITDVPKIEEYVNSESHEKPFWDTLCDHEKWDSKYNKLTYRELDFSGVLANASRVSAAVLKEDVAPDNTAIKLNSFDITTQDYGVRYQYTSKELRNNYHDLLSMIGRSLRFQTVDMTEFIKGTEFIKSRYTLTLGAGENKWRDLFAKARSVLMKNKTKGRKIAILTTEALESLEAELESNGVKLSDTIKDDINIEGVIGKYKGFDIVERTDTFLYNAGDQYAIFLSEYDRMGNRPVKTFGGTEWEVLDKGLGNYLISDKDGNPVADANNQIGYVAANLFNFAAAHQADEAHLVCKFTLAADSATDGGAQTYIYGANANGTASSPNA